MKISMLGPEGTFSHEAGLLYETNADFVFVNTIYDVFDAVSSGKSDVAVVPIENSTSGTVGETLDALLEFDLKISKIIYLKINHNLVGFEKKNICRLYIHPLAHAQCRNYIRKNFNGVEIIHTSSNAASAKLAVNDGDGAIVPSLAVQLYRKNVLEKNVEDNGTNTTLFAVIGREYAARTGNDRTFIVFNCVDRPGILYDVLGVFAKKGINLSKIESRPNKKMGEYIFYLEFGGHAEDEVVKEVLDELKPMVVFLRLIGSYPVGA